MVKLVFMYEDERHDYVQTAEYESKEAFIRDFTAALEKALDEDEDEFVFLNEPYYVELFNESFPDIFTLEEWFEMYKIGTKKF